MNTSTNQMWTDEYTKEELSGQYHQQKDWLEQLNEVTNFDRRNQGHSALGKSEFLKGE